MIRSIFVQFRKEGIHCYPDAPAGVEFLKHPHRHMFHFKATVSVEHNDRDIEFILFKRDEIFFSYSVVCSPVKAMFSTNDNASDEFVLINNCKSLRI